MMKEWQTSNTLLIAFAGSTTTTDVAVDVLAYASAPIGNKSGTGHETHVIHTGSLHSHLLSVTLVSHMMCIYCIIGLLID